MHIDFRDDPFNSCYHSHFVKVRLLVGDPITLLPDSTVLPITDTASNAEGLNLISETTSTAVINVARITRTMISKVDFATSICVWSSIEVGLYFDQQQPQQRVIQKMLCYVSPL